mgnify:CR=1 FL=1
MKTIKASVQCFNNEVVLYTINDLAKQLDIHSATIRRYIKQGKLKARFVGHKYMITKENFLEFMNKG